jgi:RNA polymerase sigma-70 factor (ECF subfamily)
VSDPGGYERALRPLLTQAAGYARALLRNRHDAEDAVQQAALRGWERIAQYDPSRPFKGWWFAILRNCCVDILRKRQAPDSQTLDGVDPPAEDSSESLDWERLDGAMQRLSESHREILRLRYYGGLSYHEMADALDIPKGTVMSRLHLARKGLAREMSREHL